MRINVEAVDAAFDALARSQIDQARRMEMINDVLRRRSGCDFAPSSMKKEHALTLNVGKEIFAVRGSFYRRRGEERFYRHPPKPIRRSADPSRGWCRPGR